MSESEYVYRYLRPHGPIPLIRSITPTATKHKHASTVPMAHFRLRVYVCRPLKCVVQSPSGTVIELPVFTFVELKFRSTSVLRPSSFDESIILSPVPSPPLLPESETLEYPFGKPSLALCRRARCFSVWINLQSFATKFVVIFTSNRGRNGTAFGALKEQSMQMQKTNSKRVWTYLFATPWLNKHKHEMKNKFRWDKSIFALAASMGGPVQMATWFWMFSFLSFSIGQNKTQSN